MQVGRPLLKLSVAASNHGDLHFSYPQSQRTAAKCQIWTTHGGIAGYINDVQDLLQTNEDIDKTELTEDGMNMEVLTRTRVVASDDDDWSWRTILKN